MTTSEHVREPGKPVACSCGVFPGGMADRPESFMIRHVCQGNDDCDRKDCDVWGVCGKQEPEVVLEIIERLGLA